MKCVLGFDFGTQRIGVAVGQSVTGTASPITILSAHQGVPDWQQIKKLIDEWQPARLVVGLPLNMDGTEGDITQQARRFTEKLAELTQLPTETIDERLSTLAAEALVDPRKKKRVDGLAAMVIVETWLAHDKRNSSPCL